MVGVVKSLRVSAGGITAFTAGMTIFDAIIARSWTVNDTGGAAVAWTVTGSGRRRAGLAGSNFATAGEIRAADTGVLTAGTRTLDTNAIASVCGSTTATAGTVLCPPTDLLFNAALAGTYPIVLGNNEGLVVRATVPATGTWTMAVSVDWEEWRSSRY
jgi:hypothetical protein